MVWFLSRSFETHQNKKLQDQISTNFWTLLCFKNVGYKKLIFPIVRRQKFRVTW